MSGPEARFNSLKTGTATSLQPGQAAVECELLEMFSAHAARLGALSGRVLDVGGGAGLVARFMDPSVDYW